MKIEKHETFTFTVNRDEYRNFQFGLYALQRNLIADLANHKDGEPGRTRAAYEAELKIIEDMLEEFHKPG